MFETKLKPDLIQGESSMSPIIKTIESVTKEITEVSINRRNEYLKSRVRPIWHELFEHNFHLPKLLIVEHHGNEYEIVETDEEIKIIFKPIEEYITVKSRFKLLKKILLK